MGDKSPKQKNKNAKQKQTVEAAQKKAKQDKAAKAPPGNIKK